MAQAKLRGLTLVELVVVIAIISIISAITIVSLTSVRALREVQATGQTLAGHVREAQNYALTGRSSGLSDPNCSFQIKMDTVTTYHIRRRSCAGVFSVVATYELPSGINVGWGTPINFSVPRAETGLASTVQITLSKAGQNSYVCVSPNGKVEERTSVCP